MVGGFHPGRIEEVAGFEHWAIPGFEHEADLCGIALGVIVERGKEHLFLGIVQGAVVISLKQHVALIEIGGQSNE